MARRRGGILYHWQVSAFALFMIAMPVSLQLLRADRVPRYPVQLVLPPAVPYEPGVGAAPAPSGPPIAFDLSGPSGSERVAASGTTIEARKPVSLNGVDAGVVSVRVSADSNLLLRREELRRLLAGVGQGALADTLGTGEFVTFGEAQRQGINVRYDAASDSIVISI